MVKNKSLSWTVTFTRGSGGQISVGLKGVALQQMTCPLVIGLSDWSTYPDGEFFFTYSSVVIQVRTLISATLRAVCDVTCFSVIIH